MNDRSRCPARQPSRNVDRPSNGRSKQRGDSSPRKGSGSSPHRPHVRGNAPRLLLLTPLPCHAVRPPLQTSRRPRRRQMHSALRRPQPLPRGSSRVPHRCHRDPSTPPVRSPAGGDRARSRFSSGSPPAHRSGPRPVRLSPHRQTHRRCPVPRRRQRPRRRTFAWPPCRRHRGQVGRWFPRCHSRARWRRVSYRHVAHSPPGAESVRRRRR